MTSWAIVVGINEYPGSGLGPLKGAVADACDFADWALDPTGGNVAPERLYFWTYPWPDADPDRPHLAQYLAGDRPAWTFDMEAQVSSAEWVANTGKTTVSWIAEGETLPLGSLVVDGSSTRLREIVHVLDPTPAAS